jgi:hypothetical protein
MIEILFSERAVQMTRQHLNNVLDTSHFCDGPRQQFIHTGVSLSAHSRPQTGHRKYADNGTALSGKWVPKHQLEQKCGLGLPLPKCAYLSYYFKHITSGPKQLYGVEYYSFGRSLSRPASRGMIYSKTQNCPSPLFKE